MLFDLAARRGMGIQVGRAVVPCGHQVHGIMLAHAQQAARVVFVQIVHQAQWRVGIGCGAEIIFRKNGLFFIFVKHNRRRFFLAAGADGFGQIDRRFGGFFAK